MANFGFLRGNRDFSILWFGQAVSDLGSSMSTLVFPLIGYAVTHSAAQAGLATTGFLLGAVLLRLPAGALVDRWPRGRTLLLANLIAMLCYGSLALTAALGVLSLTQLIIVGFLGGAASAFVDPAFSATIRTVVPEADRPAAYAQLQIRHHAAGLIGPPVGGALFSLARSLPFLLDAVSYGLCALLVSRVRTPLPAVGGGRRLSSDVAEGLRFAWQHKTNRAILVWGGLINFSMVFVLVAVTLRLIRAGVHPAAIGLVETIAAVAGLLGSLVAPAIVSRMRTGLTTTITGVILALVVLPMTWTTSVAVTGGLLAIGTFLFPANNSGISAYLATVTPDRLQGRVNAAGGLIAEGVLPIAPLLAGVLLSRAGSVPTMLIGFAFVAVSLLPLLLSPAIRQLGRPSDWKVEQPAEVI